MRVEEASILDRRSRDRRLPLNPAFSAVSARAREALARGGLGSPRTREIWARSGPLALADVFFLRIFFYFLAR